MLIHIEDICLPCISLSCSRQYLLWTDSCALSGRESCWVPLAICPSLEQLFREGGGGVKQVSLLTVLLSAALSLWLGWSVPINAHAIRQANEQISPSTAITRYADSAVLQYMREQSIDDVIMTNLWKGHMYFYTNATAYHLLPTLSHWHKYKVNRFIGNAEDDVYLVWFYCVKMPCGDVWFYGPHTPNLDVLPELEPVAELEDGVIFKVNKAYGNADAYRAITANQPTVRSNFDLYLNDNSLHYVRDTCCPDDIQARFLLAHRATRHQ